ncbi:MAG: hypothetical protein KJ566_00890 [Nanoarchaeota archaeon]|nr:hypothetical protein [Nanoarchaeota archaeon]
MEIKKEQKNELIELVKIYPKKSDFSKLKAEIDSRKIAENFVLIIKPFLIFAITKDNSFKKVFEFLESDDFKQIAILLDKLSRESWGMSRDIMTIGRLVSKNQTLFDELNNLFLDLNLKEDVDQTNY